MNRDAAVVWPLLVGSVMFFGSLGMIGWAIANIRLSSTRIQRPPVRTMKPSVDTRRSEKIPSTEWHCRKVGLPVYNRLPGGIPALRLPEDAPAVRIPSRGAARSSQAPGP